METQFAKDELSIKKALENINGETKFKFKEGAQDSDFKGHLTVEEGALGLNIWTLPKNN